MKASDLKSIVCTALEGHPLFSAKQIRAIYNIPGDEALEQKQEIELQEKGAVLAVTPILARDLVANKGGKLVSSAASFSVFLRINQARNRLVAKIDVEDGVDAILQALVGQCRDHENPNGIVPAQDLSGIIPDDGILTNSVRFTVNIQTPIA